MMPIASIRKIPPIREYMNLTTTPNRISPTTTISSPLSVFGSTWHIRDVSSRMHQMLSSARSEPIGGGCEGISVLVPLVQNGRDVQLAPHGANYPIDDGSHRPSGDVLEEHLLSLSERIGLFLRRCAQRHGCHCCLLLSVFCYLVCFVGFSDNGQICESREHMSVTTVGVRFRRLRPFRTYCPFGRLSSRVSSFEELLPFSQELRLSLPLQAFLRLA